MIPYNPQIRPHTYIAGDTVSTVENPDSTGFCG
jgi:hypothetical protein